MAPWAEVLTGFDLLAVTVATGTAAAAAWLIPAGIVAPADVHRNLRRLFAASLLLLTVTTPAIFVLRSLDMSGAALRHVMSVTHLVLAGTDFGRVWSVRAASVVLLWLVWTRLSARRRSPTAPWVLLALMALIAWTRSATGHAGDHGDFRPAVWIDCLHLFAAGLWGGAIAAFTVAVRGVLSRETVHVKARRAIAARLSALAAAGLTLTVATGLYNAWRELGELAAGWRSSYGQILDVKIGLVIAMASLGAINRFRHLPGLVRTNDESAAAKVFRRLAMMAAAETLLMLAILAVVALLLNVVPPAALPR